MIRSSITNCDAVLQRPYQSNPVYGVTRDSQELSHKDENYTDHRVNLLTTCADEGLEFLLRSPHARHSNDRHSRHDRRQRRPLRSCESPPKEDDGEDSDPEYQRTTKHL